MARRQCARRPGAAFRGAARVAAGRAGDVPATSGSTPSPTGSGGTAARIPAIFDPAALDARQWARTARAAGFRAMILTAKHHDGFCLWPTATTRHSVALQSVARRARRRGARVHQCLPGGGAQGRGSTSLPGTATRRSTATLPRTTISTCAQLTELLTRYGAIAEVWFDGANGEGPNGRKQVYDWPRIWGTGAAAAARTR